MQFSPLFNFLPKILLKHGLHKHDACLWCHTEAAMPGSYKCQVNVWTTGLHITVTPNSIMLALIVKWFNFNTAIHSKMQLDSYYCHLKTSLQITFAEYYAIPMITEYLNVWIDYFLLFCLISPKSPFILRFTSIYSFFLSITIINLQHWQIPISITHW